MEEALDLSFDRLLMMMMMSTFAISYKKETSAAGFMKGLLLTDNYFVSVLLYLVPYSCRDFFPFDQSTTLRVITLSI